MQEAINEIINFAKNKMNISKIDAHISIENQKSIKLVEKLGFVLSDTSIVIFRGMEYPHNIYTLHLK